MKTVVVSDLHLGVGSGIDLLRHDEIRARLVPELEGADRVVLLGDVVELRDRPIAETLGRAAPALEAIAAAAADAEVILVPGNHDHHLIEPWLQQRAIDGAPPLGLEQTGAIDGPAFEFVAEHLAPARVDFAYPGIWIRDDVYATHGHYLDRHLTIPTLERLGVAIVERLLGVEEAVADPLLAPEERDRITPDSYERVQTPLYAFLYGLAQATVGARAGGADPSVRVWKMLSGGETRIARMRGWLLGSIALPSAVGVANRLGLGPIGSDLSGAAIARAGLAAIGEVVTRLEIGAEHLIFGHTHRRGPLPGDSGWTAGETSLWNTGSWVHMPGLLGADAKRSPYWPGTIAVVTDSGPPELRHLLDDLTRADLAR